MRLIRCYTEAQLHELWADYQSKLAEANAVREQFFKGCLRMGKDPWEMTRQ